MLVKDVVKEFVFELQVQNYSEATIKSYRNNVLKFEEYCQNEFGVTDIEDYNHLHIKKYFQYLLQKGRKATYVNGILKNIRSFFKYCYKGDYIHKNIALKVDWQREEKVVIKTFTDDEVQRMLSVYKAKNYIDIRNRCIMALLFDTGIRNLELCSLRILDVKDTVIYIYGKGRKERVVPISPMLKKIMIRYERAREEYIKDSIIKDDSYFLSYRGRRLTKEAIERVVKLCGEEAKVRNGLDVYSLSRLLGHESINITKRYLQGIQDENIIEMSVKTSPLMNLKIK